MNNLCLRLVAFLPNTFQVKRTNLGYIFGYFVCIDSKYVLNGFPYTVADSEQPADQTVHGHVVMKLTQLHFGKRRNITTGSHFTIVKLCEYFKSNSTSLLEHIEKIVERYH